MAKEKFLPFIELCSGEPEPAAHHRLLIDKLEQVEAGMIKRLMVFMPPGSAKSTYASVLFPPWYLGKNPKKNVITAAYGQALSKRFGKKARNILSSEEFRKVFGFGLSAGTSAKDEWEVEPGGEYTATSVEGAITGRRADILLVDDPVKGRKEAESELIRDNVWEWWLSDFRTRLKPGGGIIIIQTRWHEDDLSGRILPEDYQGQNGQVLAKDGEVWEVVCIRAEAEEDDPLGRGKGEMLWPEWFKPGTFEQEKITQGPRNWNALYQQRPSPEDGDYFLNEYLRWYDKEPKHLRIYGASDYAVTRDGGDYTVHGVAGLDPDDDLYILDWWRGQTASDIWVDQWINLCQKRKPIEWAEEAGQIEKGVGPFLTKKANEEKVYVARRQFSSSTDKSTRGQSIRGRFAQGKVYLPRNAPWVAKLVAEMMSFPNGVNDDQVDVLSLFGRMLDKMFKASKPKPGTQKPGHMTYDYITMDEAKGRKSKYRGL